MTSRKSILNFSFDAFLRRVKEKNMIAFQVVIMVWTRKYHTPFCLLKFNNRSISIFRLNSLFYFRQKLYASYFCPEHAWYYLTLGVKQPPINQYIGNSLGIQLAFKVAPFSYYTGVVGRVQ